MKLRSVTLCNVRRFTDPVRIDGICDGLNVLCEPNEHGKSTLFDAIQALFFSPHGSKTRDVRALSPHAGGAPEVTVEVETVDGRFALTKRWISKPTATVTRDGRLIAQADEAEAWIGRLLGDGEGGPAGLVWVRQGMTALSAGSKKEQDASLEARRDLMSTVGHEVETMTGGRRMDAALSRCRADLADYATSTGRPRVGGPWKAAQDRVGSLEARQAELAATTETLHEALETRKRRRRDLSELEAPEAATARQVRLAETTEAYDAAMRHAETVESEARKVEAARLAVAAAQGRLDSFRLARTEHDAARSDADRTRVEADAAAAAHTSAAKDRDAAQVALESAQERQTAADEVRRVAQRRHAAQQGAARRADLLERIGQAEAARQTMEEAAAAARLGPDGATLRKLESLATDLVSAIAGRDAAATQIVMTYAAGVDGKVQLDGANLPGGRAVAVPQRARLTIEGVGELEVRPGSAEQDRSAVGTAERALRVALDAAGTDSLEAARVAAEERIEAERRRGEAQAVLGSLAPQGIEQLRTALVAIPAAEDAEDGADPAEAEALLAKADADRIGAQIARDAAAERLSDARSAAARAEVASTGAADRLRRAVEGLRKLGDVSEDQLLAEFDRRTGALQAAEALHAEKALVAPDLDAARAALTRAKSVEDEARRAISRLREELATLDERILRSSGEAVEERLAEAEQELTLARANLERVEHEVAVLSRLEAALEAAKTAARERYFAPVAAELKPLLQLLWPQADLTWGSDTLLPDALVRNGETEPIEVLSGGTQEQIALLVRLAFARMLARSGRHAPVILDDALVFTDDDRIERMFDALHRQAGDLQILVLSCRQRAFRGLGGRVLRLGPLAAASAE